MCLNGRFITNPYDGQKCFVTCGHCPACLQEKANHRMVRIKNESNFSGLVALFCTLHYENNFVPYIKASDYRYFLADTVHRCLNVYRGKDVLRQYDGSDIPSVYVGNNKPNFSSLKFLRVQSYNGRFTYLYDKVGVLQLDDIQKFFKRFYINCRRFGYEGKISYFYSCEYGGQYGRPHFHALVFVEKSFIKDARLLLNKSWPYADLLKLRKTKLGWRNSIELARNPAAYVASYINQRENVSPLLSNVKQFTLKYHFSKGFGFSDSQFSLASLLQRVRECDLSYSYPTVRDGVSTISQARIPKHVLFRYFPKFKGYRLLSNNEVECLVRAPQSIFFNKTLQDYLTYEEKCYLFKLLFNLKKRIPLDLRDDWLSNYAKVWSLFASQSIKDSYEDVTSLYDIFYHFVNVCDFYETGVEHEFLTDALKSYNPPLIIDPNYFPQNYSKHQFLLKSYNELFKHHQIKSLAYED